jgi:hypothetical protein
MITREQQYFEPPPNALVALGRRVILACQGSGRALLLLGGAILQVPYAFSRKNRRGRDAAVLRVGIKSLGVVSVVGLFTG